MPAVARVPERKKVSISSKRQFTIPQIYYSLLGFDKANEFSLEKVFTYDDRKKFVRLFINNKYDDIYYIEPISSGNK